MGDFGREFSLNVQRDVNLENKGRKLPWTDFKMGVTGTLLELSEWTLNTNVWENKFSYYLLMTYRSRNHCSKFVIFNSAI